MDSDNKQGPQTGRFAGTAETPPSALGTGVSTFNLFSRSFNHCILGRRLDLLECDSRAGDENRGGGR